MVGSFLSYIFKTWYGALKSITPKIKIHKINQAEKMQIFSFDPIFEDFSKTKCLTSIHLIKAS